jgi:phosphate transport system permease protein
MISYYLPVLIAAAALAYFMGRQRAFAVAAGDPSRLHSLPNFHGSYAAIWAAGPPLLVLVLWSAIAPRIYDRIIASRFADALSRYSDFDRAIFFRDARAIAHNAMFGTTSPEKEAAAAHFQSLWTWGDALLGLLLVAMFAAGLFYALGAIAPRKRTRHFVERVVMAGLLACSVVAILTTVGIVLSLIFESIRFFQQVPILAFLFGTHWSPQSAFVGAGAEQAANAAVFGAIPLFTGTLLITAIAMLVAAPIGLMSAIYLSDYASKGFRSVAKPVLEVLAGIPTVVYGFFAALTVAPFFRRLGESAGLSVSSESALAAGLVMGIMIIPFVSSLSDDVINAVPQTLRDGALAMGATRSETIRNVVLPAALPGIVAAMLLAVSRAIGETMIVVMAAGLAANLTFDPLEAVTTVTVQIVTLLVGDQEFDSPKTLAAFALGLMLFCITLALNVIALRVVQRYRERYD